MSTEKTNTRIYRDRVLKCITEKPGMVVYRDDIVQQTELTDDQVMGCMSQLLRDNDNPLSKDIEIVVNGRAWRYVPNQRVQRAVRAVSKVDPRIAKAIAEGRPLPLTHRIREYFAANERRVVYMDELHKAVNVADAPVTEEQVRVGVANARIHNGEFRKRLTIVTPGKAWIYDENGSVASSAVLPPSTTAAPVNVPSSPAVPSSTSPSPSPSSKRDNAGADENEMLLLEFLGHTSDGGSLYRDDNKTVYRVYRV